MLAMLIAAALGQPNVLAVLAGAEAHGNRVELLERPAGVTTGAFAGSLVAEAGAASERTDREVPVDGVLVRMVAVRSPGAGLLLYIPVAADGKAICRVVKVKPVRTPPEERRRIDRFCVKGLASR
jgi:hypothetical protein